ncbi:ABC transporter permease [Pseudotenacibaculum sp. MALMAid0570]|uniref:ABC transporter permease n=1 Tax=Pseudotenacibaculum sp. MALMAid0570 TaxID=3143938 RepID=UPI0032DFADEA
MLLKLQKKTLNLTQIIGYTLTLFIGIVIILTTIQLFLDAKPLLFKDSSVFESKSTVISKQISIFKSLDKEKIYFTQSEIDNLKKQKFAKDVSLFTSARFKVKAQSKQTANVPMFSTDLFFESISEKHLDVKPEDWKWGISQDFIPIIIPEDYVNLYNFGFAESQGLPVVSKNTISQIEFHIEISGNSKSQLYSSKIVGFSNKINSILVPQDFMLWANNEFGELKAQKTSRVLVEFNDPSDEGILKYFNDHNYTINKENLEFGKLFFFFKSALIFVFIIAIIIIILSVAFILMSLNLIIHKNKDLILNLYHIGYNHKKIAKFYQIIISSTTFLAIVVAIIVSSSIRNSYLKEFQNFFDFSLQSNRIVLFGAVIMLILILLYNLLLTKNIKKIVFPKRMSF